MQMNCRKIFHIHLAKPLDEKFSVSRGLEYPGQFTLYFFVFDKAKEWLFQNPMQVVSESLECCGNTRTGS